MVSFRFHLVSLTAVFLALAIGVAMGAAVVDRATVDLLESRLGTVAARADETQAESERLQAEVDRWQRFADEADDSVVLGRLRETTVLFVAAPGTEREAVARLQRTVVSAGASLTGTIWLSPRLLVATDADAESLASVVGRDPARNDDVRRAALAQLAAALGRAEEGVPTEGATTTAPGPPSPNGLVSLASAGALEFESPAERPTDLAGVPAVGTRLVIVSGPAQPGVNEDVAVPVTKALALEGVLAVAVDLSTSSSSPSAPFARALRFDRALAGRVSTVDNGLEFRGRVAAVYALADLGRGRFGHYGTGPRATRLLPEP